MLLSLDVAFAHLGWSVFEGGRPIAVGVISHEASGKPRISDERADRCAGMTKQLLELVGKHRVQGVIGELPSGSQNAAAANLLGWAGGLVVSACTTLDLPAEWVGQNDVKRAVTGRLNATKEEIMDRVAMMYGWEKAEKVIEIKEGRRAGKTSTMATYHVLGERFPKGTFEHVADSIGVYWASKHRNLVRMFG